MCSEFRKNFCHTAHSKLQKRIYFVLCDFQSDYAYLNLFESFISLMKSVFWSTFFGLVVGEESHKDNTHFIISKNKV